MKLFGKGIDWKTGLAIGVGTAILAPLVLPAVAATVKPVVKGLMKVGMVVFDKGREVAEEAKETIEDLAAEARSELDESEKAKIAPLSEKKVKTSKSTS